MFKQIEENGIIYNIELDKDGSIISVRQVDKTMANAYENETGKDMVLDVLNESLKDNIFD
tara:strand:- start:226 stop:405 length:180 start_codon:yes stop_codon:yes gene_type:complete